MYNNLADLDEKNDRKEDLETLFKSKAKEIAMTEEALKEEINEIKERLEILQVVKMRDWKKTMQE